MTSVKSHLVLAVTATVLAWAVWLTAIVITDPEGSGAFGLIVFYAAFFAAAAGSATIIGLFVRRHAPNRDHAIISALRQGILTGLAIVIAAILQSKQLLTWLNMIFLIIALTLLELFLISLRKMDRKNAGSYEPMNP